MDRREAILRELNLYPQWVRRNQPVPVTAKVESVVPIAPDSPAEPAQPIPPVSGKDGTGAGQRENPVSVPPLTPPMQGGGDAQPDGSVVMDAEETLGDLGWPELRQRVRACDACRLRAGCTQTVFGVGDEKADWLFVGEGPGADEDAQGEPFVGQAGKLLDNMLAAISLKRGRNVYIANIVKCRPPDNRTPAADEIAQCMPYLQRQIELIQPKMIVALGKVASNALLGRDATLASLRGKVHDYRGIPLIVTYHPAYLLRSPTEKAKAWQDLCMAVRTRHGEA
jgi:uracil-DNA glycosylase family 4